PGGAVAAMGTVLLRVVRLQVYRFLGQKWPNLHPISIKGHPPLFIADLALVAWQYRRPLHSKMPAVLKIDPRRRIVSTTFHGQVTTAEFIAHRDTILANARFDNGFADLVDLSAISINSVDEAALRALASGPSIFGEGAVHVI